ncbi:MAG: hypothetical protein JWR63_552 [Conexibacter sp.]|nr:hypothetical protein [Conexibacter sp.]
MSAGGPPAEPERVGPRNVDFKAVARVSTQVTLSAVRLRMGHAALSVDAEDVPPDWSPACFVWFSTHAHVDSERSRLRVHASFVALYLPGFDGEADELPDPDESEPAVDVEAGFELVYDFADPDAFDDDDAEHFAFANGTLHAWPYWREFAHSASGRMGVAPLIIGTYKIPSVHDPGR